MDVVFFEEPDGGGVEPLCSFGDDRGDKLIDVLKALLTAGVGAGVSWWHIRAARKREAPEPRGPVTSRPITPPAPPA